MLLLKGMLSILLGAHLAYIRDANGDPREVIDLDGVGGVSILARAKIFRQGYISQHLHFKPR